MAKKKPKPQIDAVIAEIRALRAELAELKDSVRITKPVRVEVDGPRRSEVFIDAQAISMSGEFKRSGSRDVELDPPEVNVDVVLKGLVGTATALAITINDKTKKEEFVTEQEKEIRSFSFPFSAFGL